mmetsp:Transcript_38815/g.61479  ORF Transcript_38815/g.61479 Transcript_38815/m.61479 type:complete len:89 (+) Transcript_38815:1772-2038(+)
MKELEENMKISKAPASSSSSSSEKEKARELRLCKQKAAKLEKKGKEILMKNNELKASIEDQASTIEFLEEELKEREDQIAALEEQLGH